ncbi:MAG: CoA transferase [Anaerolineae bacterium]|nr:CoA transferase [Anaerolineae bacterium]
MQALDDLRVLDFTRVLAGPFCSMLLADYGAEVIKVERPGTGDDTRQWGPPWVGDPAQKRSAYFWSVNRNKRSLTLNLQTAEGQAVAHQLALTSDILIENFKVGQMRGYGLDYEALHAVHPRLIYCSITGYGQDSPLAHQPGYDFVIQGQSGLMSITGPADGEPYKVGVAISDVITGLTAANAIQAAVYHRARSGEGQFIDIALLDSQIAALVNIASGYLVSHDAPSRYGNAHPNIVPYEVFQAADKPFILAVGNDAQFVQVCTLLGLPDMVADPHFASNPARVAHRAALIRRMAPILRQKPAREWIDLLLAVGVPAGPIEDIPSALENPHIRARGLVQPVALADGTPIDMVGPAAKLSTTPPTIRHAPPLLGQHTDEILRERLNLDKASLDSYRKQGIL